MAEPRPSVRNRRARIVSWVAALALAIGCASAGADTANLLPNGGFDSGSLSGWKTAHAKATLVPGEGGSGYAVQVSYTSGSFYQLAASPGPVQGGTAGVTYAAGGDLRSDAPGRSVCLVLTEVTPSGATAGSAKRCTTATSAWSPMTAFSYTLKASGDSFGYAIRQSSPTPGDSFQVDNLALAVASTDTAPPSAPTGFTAGTTSETSIATTWTASTDNVGVAGYRLYLGATQVATTTGTTYTFTGLACGTAYQLGVSAYDASGNTSAPAQMNVQTAACTAPPPQPTLRSQIQTGTVTSATVAGFTFSDAQAGVTFACSVDGSAFAPCTSPDNVSGLGTGPHTFAVQASDASGNVSPPGSLAWTVSQPGVADPCGQASAPPATYQHVIVIVFENENLSDIVGGPQTPFTTQLAQQCGLATQDFAVARPSLPNYIALTSGSTQGITDDAPPSKHPLAVDNVFHQVQAAGSSWREYSSMMPTPCDATNDLPAPNSYYTVHHEPAPYYTDLAQSCPGSAIPLGTTTAGALASDLANNTLPALAWIGPSDDGGDTALGGEVDPTLGDFFLRDWIGLITSSAAYQAGTTAIVITWDEGDFKHASTNASYQNVPLIVVAPSVAPGATTAVTMNHYAVLRAVESMLGLPLLGAAADPSTPDLRALLGF
jgi:chitodextrinase